MASGQRSSGRFLDLSSRMQICMPVQQTAIAKWDACKSFIGRHHLLVMLLLASLAIRVPDFRNLLLPSSLLHLLAWACCLSDAPASQRSMHTIASSCSILAWVLRYMVNQRSVSSRDTQQAWTWIIRLSEMLMAAHLTPVLERALAASTYAYAADAFVFSLEMAYALMWVPPVIATGLLAMHLRVYYQIVKRARQPGVVATAVWVLAEVALPHLMHYYMHRAAQLRCAQSHHAAGTTPQAVPPCKKASTPEKDKGKTADGTDWAAARVKGVGEPCASSVRATAAGPAGAGFKARGGQGIGAPHIPITRATATGPAGAGAQASASEVHEHTAVPLPLGSSAQAPQVALPHALAPSLQVLQALRNAQALQQCAFSQYTYRSRLAQPQALVIKLQSAEPEQLRQDLIAAVNTAMNKGRAGMLTVSAGVRRGCTLLVLGLMQRSGSQQAGQPLDNLFCGGFLKQTNVQALLGSLLAPGTSLPDRAVAYVQMGGQEVQAVWQQDTATWVITKFAGDNQLTPTKPVTASLLYVDHPVVRLQPEALPGSADGSSGSTSSSSSSSSMHRVSLLLQLPQPAPSVVFVGSDQISAPPEQPADGKQVPVQCVARGCWGTCLPVEVAGVEVQEGEGGKEHVGHSSLAALALDVDLSQPPSAGSVQLELWCGRALLASAPLLLLPKASDSSSCDSNLLLEELQQCVGQLGWSEGAQSVGAKPSSGASALLADLGQVLYSAECVQRAAVAAGPAQAGSSSSSSNSAPSSSWGGIVAGLAAQHASDPDTLSGVIFICEGLLEYAQEQGSTHTADLLSECASRLQQRLQQVQGAGASTMAAPSAKAAIPAATASSWFTALAQAVWMPHGSTDRLARMAHAPSVKSLGSPGATSLWASNTSLFAIYHLLCALLALSTCIRAASQRLVTASLFSVHVMAWFCCREGRSTEHARRLQTVATICGVSSWALRTLLHLRWSAGLPLTPVLQTALGTSFVWPAETFMCLLETVHALMLFSSALVSLLLAVHLSVVYSSLKTVQGQPNFLHAITWALVNLAAPHVAHYHLRATAQAQIGLSTHVDVGPSMCSAAAALSATPAERLAPDRASTKLA